MVWSRLYLGPYRWLRSWQLLTESSRVLVLVLATDVVAIAVVAATARHPRFDRADWIRFAVLTGCAIAYVELTRGVERIREVTDEPSPVSHADSAWGIAAMLVLPALLAVAVVGIVFTWIWLRLWCRRRPPYRWIFSVATIVLGTEAGAAILSIDPHTFPGAPTTPATLSLAVLAIVTRFVLNFFLVFAAIALTTPGVRPHHVIGSLKERVTELGTFGLGLLTSAVLIFDPVMLVGIAAASVLMHQGILTAQFRRAARMDAKTGLTTPAWWQQLAETALSRARTAGTGLALLMLDLDHFKRVNDTHGHLAGDQVLAAVAKAITGEIRKTDTAGRWGGEEFVILVPDVDQNELIAIAERIRRHISDLVITNLNGTSASVGNLTVSVGAARYPSAGVRTVDDLVLAADTALYQAKKAGRDQIVTAD